MRHVPRIYLLIRYFLFPYLNPDNTAIRKTISSFNFNYRNERDMHKIVVHKVEVLTFVHMFYPSSYFLMAQLNVLYQFYYETKFLICTRKFNKWPMRHYNAGLSYIITYFNMFFRKRGLIVEVTKWYYIDKPVVRLFWYRKFGYIFRRFLSGMDRNPEYPAWHKNALKDLGGMYAFCCKMKKQNIAKYIESTQNIDSKLNTTFFGNLDNFF